MASVGVLSARPQLSGARLNRSASKRVGKVSTVVRAEHKPGINMPEGDPNALNKWSRKITQPKSQGASQVRLAIPVRSSERSSRGRSTGAARPARGDGPPALARDQSLTAGTLESAKPRSVAHLTFPLSALTGDALRHRPRARGHEQAPDWRLLRLVGG